MLRELLRGKEHCYLPSDENIIRNQLHDQAKL